MPTPLLATKLIELRQKFHYSQQNVADYLGVSRVAYSHYERNTRQPSLEMIVMLCKLYQINVSDLINDETVLLSTDTSNETQVIETSMAFANVSFNSISSTFITKNIKHFLTLFTGKNATIDFTDISKQDMEVLAQYKKLSKQNQKEVRQFIKFKQQINKE